MKAATLEVEIGAKIDKFERSLGKVRKDLKGMEKRLGGVSRGANKATTAFSGMAKRLIAVGLAYFGARGIFRMAKSFLDVSTSIETYKLRLEAMLGSQEAATEAMAFFKDVAAKVPFTLEKVIEAGVQVQAFGADLKKWTPILADLAAYMDTTIPEAASALGRAFAGGAGAADIFREKGILQVIKDFAKMERSIDDITKLSLAEFRDVMFEAFSAAESKIGGTADKLATTWVGVISMLQDKWFQFKDTVMKTKVFELMKEGLVSFNESMDKFVETGQLEEWAKNMAIGVIDAFSVIVKGVEGLIFSFQVLKAAIYGAVRDLTAQMRTYIEKLIIGFGLLEKLGVPVKKILGDLVTEWINLVEEESRLNETIEETTDKMAGILTSFDKLKERLNAAKDAIKDTKEEMGELGEKTDGVVESTQVYSKEMVKLIAKMTDEVMKLTLHEFEYRKAIALKSYEERKALLEKEKAGKQAFALLEKSLAVALEQIEKDKTEAIKKGYKERGEAITAALLAWGIKLEELKKKFMYIFSEMAYAVSDFFSQIGNLSQVHFDNQMIALDKLTNASKDSADARYEADKNRIENSMMSEEEKAEALEALEEKKIKDEEKRNKEYEKRKKAIQKKAFDSEKKVNLVTAAMNIAVAVTRALPDFILAAITAAAGLVQLAAIHAQTFPGLEKGGWIPRPMPVMAGHGPKGEIIAQPSLLAKIISQEMPRVGSPGMGFAPATIQPIVNIYAQTLNRDTVDRASEMIYDALEREGRRRG